MPVHPRKEVVDETCTRLNPRILSRFDLYIDAIGLSVFHSKGSRFFVVEEYFALLRNLECLSILLFISEDTLLPNNAKSPR